MRPEALVHITTAGERWDLIAWTFYGDASLYQYIIMANPTVAIVPELSPGTTLTIPIIAISQTPSTPLPPWRR